MIDYRTADHVMKVGQQPDPLVMSELRRKHPTVILAWHDEWERWVLIDSPPGLRPVIIRKLEHDGEADRPSLANTVYVLDELHPSNLNDDYAIDRFLGQIDGAEQQARVDRDARERIAEGSRELYNQFKKRRIFQMRKPGLIVP